MRPERHLPPGNLPIDSDSTVLTMLVSGDKCLNESYSTDMNLLQCLLVVTNVLMKVIVPI